MEKNKNKNKNKRKSSLAFGKTVLSKGNHKLSHVLGILRIINESIILACQAFERKAPGRRFRSGERESCHTSSCNNSNNSNNNNNNNNNNSIIIINFIQVLCNFSMVLLIGDTNRQERMSYSLLKQANCMRNYNIHTDGVNSR